MSRVSGSDRDGARAMASISFVDSS